MLLKALPLLSLLAVANAAISILTPSADTVWFTNNTVTMNWTLSDPTTDTYLFRAYLSNEDQSLFQGNASIADSTNATAMFVRILLPRVPTGEGYIVNFVNTTNEQQVFATSPSFMIEQGENANTTSMMGPTSSVSRSAGGIPNAPSTSSAQAFPSASSSSPNAGHAIAAPSLAPFVQAGAVLAMAVAGMGLVL